MPGSTNDDKMHQTTDSPAPGQERSQVEVQDRTAELAASQQLLQATIDSSMHMIEVFKAVRNSEGEIVDFIWVLNNQASRRIYGDVIGKSLLQLQPGVIQENIFDSFKQVIETGEPQQYEKHYVHEQFNGWYHISVVKLDDGVATTTTDITDRKRAELELQQSKTLLQNVINAPHIGMAVYKALRNERGEIIDFVHEYINRASISMLGNQDFTGKLFSEHGENAIEQMPQLIEVLETGKRNSYTRQAELNGQNFWFAITNTRLDSERLVHTWEDVTEQQRAKDALGKAKERLELALEGAHAGSGWWDLKTGAAEWDERGKRLIGMTDEESKTAAGWLNRIYGEDRQRVIDYSAECAKEGRDFNMEYRVVMPNGEIKHFVGTGHFRKDEKGEPFEAYGLIIDFTERKKAEEQILQLKDEVAQKATDKYYTLFNSMDQGFGIGKVLAASEATSGKVDWQWLEVNPNFERLTGLPRDAVLSQTMRELVPGLEDTWFTQYAKVAATGETIAFEDYSPVLNRWFDVYVYALGTPADRLVAVLFTNTTERKQREQQQEYLVRLNDALRPLSNPMEVQRVAMRILGEHLNVDRAIYAEINIDEDWFESTDNYTSQSVQKVIGRFPFTAFGPPGEKLKKGESLIIHDVAAEVNDDSKAAFYSIDVHAVVALPLIKQGKLVADLSVHQTSPRRWLHHEIALIQETAERTWAAVERAKAEEALRKSESRLAQDLADAKLLQQFSNDVIHLNEVNDIYEMLLQTATALMQSDIASLQLYSEKTESLTLVAHKNFHLESAAFWSTVSAESGSVCGEALRRQSRITVTDVQTEDFAKSELSIFRLSGIRAVNSTPIISSNGKLIGMLNTQWKQPRSFSEEDFRFFDVLVRQAADLIERKQAEETLRQNEERLQKALSIETVGVIYFDLEGGIHDCNAAFERMSGFAKEDFAAGSVRWTELTPPEFMEVTLKSKEELSTAGQNTPYEKQYIRPDGSRWWGLFAGKRLCEKECVEFVVDITERKNTEEALKLSEDRFRTLADAVPQVIWTNTAEGEANYFNQRWYEYTGLSYEEAAGPGWQLLVHPDDAAASKEKWMKALAAGEIFDTEYRLKNQHNEYCWFIGRNVPLKDEAGKVTGWFGSATDIEDLKKTSEALSQSEERLRITMESATDYAIITMDTDRRVERWSKGAEEILGYREEEMIGQSADIIFTEEDMATDQPQKEMETARDTGRAADERWHKRKDGSRFFASGVMRPIQNDELTGYVKVLRDTTQQQLFTQELHRLVAERTKELQRSNEDLQQFAHVASHDLKEPVRKIQTFNNRILEEYADELPEKVKFYANKIGTSADRMVAMIEGVLLYSKAGKTEQELEEVELGSVMQQIHTDLEVYIDKRDAVIVTTDLPTISANRILVYQLFYNLVLNALKFAKDGVPPRVEIKCVLIKEEGRELAKITVSDNGIGFDQEYAGDIFKTFTRLHPYDDYEGTGLGLALCKKIVERHGGSISASGQPGVGATFTILLPIPAKD
ncbi:PAS domain S-box protein [Aridibaculum aurantiacum]|uniref:PAS domain S-box protein n=1 Tax=Aridibaculum aurantiacum TaxID=2810307 RepID=UPI001A976BBD|nr:PAS domain S-box protein [Aridibaculum aurantiacum]